MTNLSVNINKVATLRNARGENTPDVLAFALECERLGADGITVHPRPDERHIRRADVYALRPALRTEFNIEGYPSAEFMDLVLKVKPAQATLVPDPPEALTSSAGWDCTAHRRLLTEVIDRLREAGIRSSIFVDPSAGQVAAAALCGADRVELYTKPYADAYGADPAAAVAPYVEAASAARAKGLGVNAGHDLSLRNLKYFHDQMPWLSEVSIGHALISDALYMGIGAAIKAYRACLGK